MSFRDCEICGHDLSQYPKEIKICDVCQRRIDMFESHGLELTFCQDCIFGDSIMHGAVVRCHRHAPSITANVYDVDKWSKMEPNEWCGEGRKRK